MNNIVLLFKITALSIIISFLFTLFWFYLIQILIVVLSAF